MSQTGTRPSPYRGPAAFRETDSPFFRGRERETAELCYLLSAHRTGILYSGSGAGKTSLVHAGLKPRLSAQHAIVRILRVGVQPNLPSRTDSPGNVFIANAVSSAFPESERPPDARLSALIDPLSDNPHVLVFDQFEEIFTKFLDRWEEREAFFREVNEILLIPTVRVLFCVREEYLASMGPYEAFLTGGFRLRYHLERLRARQALAAIEEPAKALNCPFDKHLAEGLVEDLRKERVQTERGVRTVVGEFVEPLQLQVVCEQIWKALPEDAKSINAEHVRQYGSADAALGSYFEASVRDIAASGKVTEARLRGWFEKELITPGGLRGTVNLGPRFTGGIRNEVVRLIDATHLIRGESRAGSTWYELAHDRFIDPIKESNRAWRRRRGLESNLAEWVAAPLSVAILLGAIALSFYALFTLWSAADWFGHPLPVSFETRLLCIVAVSGAIGSFLNSARQFTVYLATRSLKSSWIWLYFARVPLDAGLAVICYCLLRASVAPSPSGRQVVNSFGVFAIGVLTGLFGRPVLDKLRDTADEILRTAPGTGDDERSDRLSRPLPAIFESSPAELHSTTESVWIALYGSALVPGATALLGGEARRTAYIDETELRVLLAPGDASKAGTLVIEAELPPPARTRSNPFSIPIL